MTTLFFISPNNPINLSTKGSREYFQANFFQRWAFFAPPPTYNQRVYIVFKDKNTQAKNVFEILAPILNEKHKNAPFNSSYQLVDYIIASSLINIDENLKLLQDVFDHENLQSKDKVGDSMRVEKLVNEIEKTSDFRTLSNYSKKIAEENGINTKDVYYQIQVSKIMISQFADREIKQGKEEITFSSHLLTF